MLHIPSELFKDEFTLLIQRDVIGNLTAIFHRPGAMPKTIETRNLDGLAAEIAMLPGDMEFEKTLALAFNEPE